MELAKAQKFLARVSDKYYVSPNEKYMLLHLELISPDRITYQAGQYISIKVAENGERRSYSIASTPDMNHGLMLLAEMVEGGKGTEYLKKVQIGEEVEILGPLGRFIVNEQASKLLFVATGSGIVPIKSMIEDLLINKKDPRQLRLHWGMRSEEDMFWFDNFERLSEEHPNFVFDQVLSRPGEDWDLCTGHVQDCLTRDFADGLGDWQGYVCGSPSKVESVSAKLIELGMKEENIYHEKFS